MISALAHRGFGYGSGVLDPGGRVFIVNMPKNASSYVLDWAQRQGWSAALADHATDVREMIVLLRDPVSRWIAGIAQYINTYILSVHGPNGPVYPGETVTEHDYFMTAQQFVQQYTDATERLIFDVISRFDDHVWPQCELVQDLLPGVRRRYFLVDQDLTDRLAQYLGWPIYVDLDRNSGDCNSNIKVLQDFFRFRLHTRGELLERLRRHYHKDYALLDMVRS